MGVRLLPQAVLVNRSRLLPRLPGVWLSGVRVASPLLSLTGALLPPYQGTVLAHCRSAFPGEVANMPWLVTTDTGPPADPTSAASATGAIPV